MQGPNTHNNQNWTTHKVLQLTIYPEYGPCIKVNQRFNHSQCSTVDYNGQKSNTCTHIAAQV